MFLTGSCSKYIRERGELERDYARGLRRLSSKYGRSQGDKEGKEGKEAKEAKELREEQDERGTERAFR